MKKFALVSIIALVLLAEVAHAFLLGEDITDKEGHEGIYTLSVQHTSELYPERLKFTLRVNRKVLLQRHQKEDVDWVFSDVEAWNMEEKAPQFLFNFSISFKEEKDGWFTTTFEISKELAKHS